MPACRSLIACIYRKNGPTTARRARKPACPTMWCSRPSRKSHLTNCVRQKPPASPRRSCWPMQGMAIPRFAKASPSSVSAMSSASTTSCGHLARSRCRKKYGVGVAVRRLPFAEMPKTSISAKALALTLPQEAWRRVTWREGSNTTLSSRFAAVRVRPAHRDYEGSKPRDEEWCLIEWPPDEAEPTKYWLSTLPAKISRRALVNTAKLRWRIERDGRSLALANTKGEVGAASTITRHSALLLMDSCSANEQLFPPQDNATPFSSKNLPYPQVIDPADPRSDLSVTCQTP